MTSTVDIANYALNSLGPTTSQALTKTVNQRD
jgi:hypothetical protein